MVKTSSEQLAGSSSEMNTNTTSSSISTSTHEYPKYKGVRKRKWGKWVSEIRLPNSRERIWLGSYDTPEKAARAFDAAQFCLRGRHAHFNFPDSPPPEILDGGGVRSHYFLSLSPQEIQVVAARFANEYHDQDDDDHHHNNHHDDSSSSSVLVQELIPNPNIDYPDDHHATSLAAATTTTTAAMSTANHDDMSTMDWSFLNNLDYSNDAAYDNFDYYSSFSDTLDKMHSDEFCPPDPLASAPDSNDINGDDSALSQHYSSSFLWNF